MYEFCFLNQSILPPVGLKMPTNKININHTKIGSVGPELAKP